MRKVTLKTLAMVLILMLCIPMELQASENYREIWKVVEGTATKIGETKEETIKNGFIEQWKADDANIAALTTSTTDKLLKAENVGKLPITVEEVSYDTLKRLAEEAAGDKVESVYQGYAQLNLNAAQEGYIFSGSIKEVEGKNIFTAYYADGEIIYQIKLVLKKSTLNEILPKVAEEPNGQDKSENYEHENNETQNNETQNDETQNDETEYDEPTPAPTPTPEPEPEPEPEPDTPIDVPDGPIIPLPTV